jgi:hypothetical protein
VSDERLIPFDCECGHRISSIPVKCGTRAIVKCPECGKFHYAAIEGLIAAPEMK